MSKNWIEEAISKKHIKYYNYKDFFNSEVIGSGGFGKVYRANWKNSRNILALKSFRDSTNKNIVEELKIQCEVHFHDNIIKFYGITEVNDYGSKKYYMLVMEYADGGTLQNYLEKNIANLNWDKKFKMANQLACAVSCLHDMNITHRDLRSSNVLVHQNNIKLKVDVPKLSKKYDIIPYIDPTKFADLHSLDQKSDVYSIGVLLWEISSCRSPFKDVSNQYRLQNQILQGLRETPMPSTPKDYEQIYTDCWKPEPDDRPTIQNVVSRLEEIMVKRNITTKHVWAPPINNLSRNNLSQGFNNNIYNKIKVEPLKSPSKAPQASFYKQKSKKEIVDGIAALADNIYDENKKQRILDYIKDHHTTSKEIFDWLLNNQNGINPNIVLGDFHYLGIATMVDKRKAFDYYVQAALEESSIAQYTLGILCENDEKDTFQAMYWFDKCAKQGNQDAINHYYRLKSSKNKTFNPANLHSVMGKMNLGNEEERKGFSLQDFKLPFV
ncbi:unnamed protein product [Rhizophagus irregularis]|nr:unnamed protein product [Rhizophagus irregularis]